jgi:nucleoid-associated protein YgaU
MLIVSTAWAQSQGSSESFPFEDFPDFDASANPEGAAPGTPVKPPVPPVPPTESAEASPPADLGTGDGTDVPAAEGDTSDYAQGTTSEEEKDLPVEDAAPTPPPAASQATAPTPGASTPSGQLTVTAPAPVVSQPTNTEDFGDSQESLMSSGAEFPDDVKELENRLKTAESAVGERNKSASAEDPGDELTPSDKFSRVPLRPPMSDANWLRWAGPMSIKEYKVRRGDSLWAVSERLFGNPYLWPKIWHLNGRITNPHIIDRGMVLSFNPGNPGSAPELAFRPDANDVNNTTIYPLTKLDKKRTLLETIDETLRSQINAPHPPFQYFLLDRKPEVLGKMPTSLSREGRTFFVEGDRFRINLGDGVFPVVKSAAFTERFVKGQRVRWIGLIQVQDKQATVVKAFTEIEAGDEIVQRRFQLSPLAVHKDVLGPEYRPDTHLVMLDDSARVNAGPGQMMGVLFPGIGIGPRPGALLDVQVGPEKKVQALLVDRDQRMGTLWIVSGDQEISIDDKIF